MLQSWLNSVMGIAAALVLFGLAILIAKLLKGYSAGYKLREELFEADNPAAGLATAGYYLAVACVFVGSVVGVSAGFKADWLASAAYCLLGIVLVASSTHVNSWALFRRFNAKTEMTSNRNAGVGAVRGALYLATGIVAACAINGQGGGLVTAIVFFGLGQLTLLAMARIYEAASKYNLHEELEKGNAAAGYAMAGHVVAIALVAGASVAGGFVGWQQDILSFAKAAGLGLLFLPLGRYLMDWLILPGRRLSTEIHQDGNTAAGMIEAAIAIGLGAAIAVSL